MTAPDETWLDWLNEPPVPDHDRWAVTGVAMWGSLFEIVGPTRSFKSWAVIHLARAALDGGTWLGREVGRFDHVFYVGNEKTKESLKGRMRVLMAGLSSEDAQRLHIRHRKGLRFGNDKWDRLVADVKALPGRVLVLVDTFTSMMRSGYVENDSKDGTVALHAMEDLMGEDGHVTVGLAGHPSANGDQTRLRGWSGIEGQVDATLAFKRPSLKGTLVNIEFMPKDEDATTESFIWSPETFGFTAQDPSLPFTTAGVARAVMDRWVADRVGSTNEDLYPTWPKKSPRRVREVVSQAQREGLVEVIGSKTSPSGGTAASIFGPPLRSP